MPTVFSHVFAHLLPHCAAIVLTDEARFEQVARILSLPCRTACGLEVLWLTHLVFFLPLCLSHTTFLSSAFLFCYHFTPISSLRHTVPLFRSTQVSEAEDNQERSLHADVDVIGHHPETSTQVRAYSILPSNFGSSLAGDALSLVLCS